jgi:hypothetical protein
MADTGVVVRLVELAARSTVRVWVLEVEAGKLASPW